MISSNDQTLSLYKYYADKHRGYIPYTVTSLENPYGEDSKEWQFRIAVLPTKNNLTKAAHIVADVCIPQHIEFKCFVLNHPNQKENDIALNHWLGALDNTGSDRDQRGKEICICIHPNRNSQYQLSPFEIKELMLTLWEKLIDNHVELYACYPFGDKPIHCHPDGFQFVTPFSYTAFKNWQGTHGILHQDFNQHQGGVDPFAGITIKTQDLEHFQIPKSHVLELQLFANHQQKNYVRSSINQLIRDLQELSSACALTRYQLFQQEWREYKHIIKNKNNINNILMENLGFLAQRCPHQHDPNLQAFGPAATLASLLSRIQTLNIVDDNRQQICQEITQLIDSIIDNLNYSTLITDIKANWNEEIIQTFLKDNQLIELNLNQMIEANPYRMQVLYRHLVHICHAKEALRQLPKPLFDMQIISENHFKAARDILNSQPNFLADDLFHALAPCELKLQLWLLESLFFYVQFDIDNQYHQPKKLFDLFQRSHHIYTTKQIKHVLILQKTYKKILNQATSINDPHANALLALSETSALLKFRNKKADATQQLNIVCSKQEHYVSYSP